MTDPDKKLVLVPTPGPLSTELQEDVESAKRFASHSRAANTVRAYESDWKQFKEWCVSREQEAENAKPGAVAAFLSWFIKQDGIHLPTVLRAYSGIAKFFRLRKSEGWPERGRPIEISEVLSGMQRDYTHVVKKKQAVTEKELKSMLSTIEPGIEGIRNRALILTGFFGAFRRTALVSLDVSDVTFEPAGMKIVIRRDKTDQKGKGRIIGILYTSNPSLCAIRALQAWFDVSGIKEGPIFRSFSRTKNILNKRLPAEVVANVVKKLALAANLDPTRFGGHSLRAGFVTQAARKGKSLAAIMQQTGHVNSDTVLGYIRYETVFDDNATEGLI